MNFFFRQKAKPLPLTSVETALDLVERFHSESALTDNARLQRLFLSAAVATNDQIEVTSTGTAAFEGCLAQCRRIDNLTSGIAEVKASQDQLQSRLGLASAFQSANRSMIENLNGTMEAADERLSKLKSIADMCAQGANELESRKPAYQPRLSNVSSTSDVRCTCEDIEVGLKHAVKVLEDTKQQRLDLQAALERLETLASAARRDLARARACANAHSHLCHTLSSVELELQPSVQAM